MKDKEINDKLIVYGKNLRIGFSIMAILILIGGFIIARQASKVDDSVFFSVFVVYILYTIGVAVTGYIIELVFNWMAAVLRNLMKNNK